MINAVIIDDKESIRNAVAGLLNEYCRDVEIIGMAESVKTGYEVILSVKPDLVFLDVEIIGGSGFDILEMFDRIDFRIIFITAYDHFAVKAFKMNALDYLLKPVDSDELVEAVNRYKQLAKSPIDVTTLVQNLKNPNEARKIAIYSTKQIQFVDIAAIVRCESDGSYTKICLMDGENILSTRLLKEYEELLEGHGFFRLHRSHLINLSHVRNYIKRERDQVVMVDESVIEVHRKVRQRFLAAMSKINL